MALDNDRYEPLLAQLQDQSDELGGLSTQYEAATRQAYLNARVDITERMEDLIERRGGLENLSARDRFRLTRDSAMIQSVEERLDQLGVEHQSLVNQAFTDAGQLANKHLPTEIRGLLDHLHEVEGVMPGLTATDFARLDSAAIELGLGTAVRDTQTLAAATQVEVTRRIQQGVVAGEGIPQLSRRLAVLPEISQQRAEVITRWTTIKGYNLSAQAAYQSAATSIPGLRKMWLAARDERTCGHCMALHGMHVAVDGEFPADATYAASAPEVYTTNEVPPRHPRCRCTIVSWTEDWRAYTEATPEELHAEARSDAAAQGFEKAVEIQGGIAPVLNIGARAADSLGDMFAAISLTDDAIATVRFVGDLGEARLRLRNTGFRVRRVEGADDLLRIELPGGVPVPRMIRSARLRALPDDRWDTLRDALLRCGARR